MNARSRPATAPDHAGIRELIAKGSDELGIRLTSAQSDSLVLHLTELHKWNRTINLTAIQDQREMVIKHVLDSLTYLQCFDFFADLHLLDMGSGTGFPAVPIKIAHPDIRLVMVDSVKKKTTFLRHIVRTLGMTNTIVFDSRMEDLPGSLSATFDVLTARAFADMETALKKGSAFLKTSGRIVLSRGPDETIPDEVIAHHGYSLDKKLPLTLPFSDYRRQLWVFRKN